MEIPRHWRLKKQRYSLLGEVCPDCKTKIFPPRDTCPECGIYIQALSSLARTGQFPFKNGKIEIRV